MSVYKLKACYKEGVNINGGNVNDYIVNTSNVSYYVGGAGYKIFKFRYEIRCLNLYGYGVSRPQKIGIGCRYNQDNYGEKYEDSADVVDGEFYVVDRIDRIQTINITVAPNNPEPGSAAAYGVRANIFRGTKIGGADGINWRQLSPAILRDAHDNSTVDESEFTYGWANLDEFKLLFLADGWGSQIEDYGIEVLEYALMKLMQQLPTGVDYATLTWWQCQYAIHMSDTYTSEELYVTSSAAQEYLSQDEFEVLMDFIS